MLRQSSAVKSAFKMEIFEKELKGYGDASTIPYACGYVARHVSPSWSDDCARRGRHGMLNLLSSSKKRRPSKSSWLGKAWSRFMKLLTRMKKIIKMSRCTNEVKKKW